MKAVPNFHLNLIRLLNIYLHYTYYFVDICKTTRQFYNYVDFHLMTIEIYTRYQGKVKCV